MRHKARRVESSRIESSTSLLSVSSDRPACIAAHSIWRVIITTATAQVPRCALALAAGQLSIPIKSINRSISQSTLASGESGTSGETWGTSIIDGPRQHLPKSLDNQNNLGRAWRKSSLPPAFLPGPCPPPLPPPRSSLCRNGRPVNCPDAQMVRPCQLVYTLTFTYGHHQGSVST